MNTPRCGQRGCELDNQYKDERSKAHAKDLMDPTVACFDEQQGGFHPNHPYWGVFGLIAKQRQNELSPEAGNAIENGYRQVELLRLKYGWESTQSCLNGTFLETQAMMEYIYNHGVADVVCKWIGIGKSDDFYEALSEGFQLGWEFPDTDNLPTRYPEHDEIRDFCNSWKPGNGDREIIEILDRLTTAIRPESEVA